MGVRLRALREERELTQAQMAQQLGISPSYLNQIENNERPLTVQVLLRIQSRLDVDPQFFSDDDDARLLAQLRDAIADMATDVPPAELQGFVQQMPALAKLFTRLHTRCRNAEEQNINLAGRTDHRNSDFAGNLAQPDEEVREFFYTRRNYIDALDTHAESLHEELLATTAALEPPAKERPEEVLRAVELIPLLKNYLQNTHSLRVQNQSTGGKSLRHYDPETKVLQIDAQIEPAQQAFQLANQLAHLEANSTIEATVAEAEFSGDDARKLTVVGLANYFAGALLLPYRRFLAAAER